MVVSHLLIFEWVVTLFIFPNESQFISYYYLWEECIGRYELVHQFRDVLFVIGSGTSAVVQIFLFLTIFKLSYHISTAISET